MDIFAALLLMAVMYFVVPVAVCAATIIALGGAGRFLPGGMRDRALASRETDSEHR